MRGTKSTLEIRVPNFPECERALGEFYLWMLVVEKQLGREDPLYMIRIRSQENRVEGFLYFTNDTLPDYLKDSIAMISAWYQVNKPTPDWAPTHSIIFRPDGVPKEFDRIGWIDRRLGNRYIIAVTWDQLVDLYENGPKMESSTNDYTKLD